MSTNANPRRSARHVILATVALALVATPFASGAEASITQPYQPRKTVALSPGITYSLGKMKTTGGRRQSVRIAQIETTHPSVRLKSVLSNDRVVGREVVTAMAKRKSTKTLRAMAATNGDRPKRDAYGPYAAPHSMAVSNREVMVAVPCTRPTLGIDPDGSARIADVRIHVTAHPTGYKHEKQIHRVNTPRDTPQIALYTKRFASSTLTTSGGVEVVLELQEKLRPNGTQMVKVLKVRKGGGNTRLRGGQAVLSVKNPRHKWVYKLKVGQRFPLTTQVVKRVDNDCGGTLAPADNWENISEALGGNHFTTRNGKVAAPSASEYQEGAERHPRTGVGIKADGTVLMVTVDGRRRASVGVNLKEMGQLFRSLGAKHAFNLDGGGSTVFARRMLDTGKFAVDNVPSDGRQRPTTMALVAFKLR